MTASLSAFSGKSGGKHFGSIAGFRFKLPSSLSRYRSFRQYDSGVNVEVIEPIDDMVVNQAGSQLSVPMIAKVMQIATTATTRPSCQNLMAIMIAIEVMRFSFHRPCF